MRVEKTKNYSVISNEFIRRKDLSWKAKGILTYVLTLPDDWVINLKEIMTHATEGEAAFRSGWKELTKAGYVTRRAVRDGQRIKYWETVIRENPDVTSNSLLGGFQDVENLDVENLDVDNRKLLSTNNTKYLIKPSTNNTNSARHKYGDNQNVLMTDDEHKKLSERFPNDLEKRINNLSYYMSSTGKSYKSHYMTIIAWARKDEQNKPQQFQNSVENNKPDKVTPEMQKALDQLRKEREAYAKNN